MGICLISFHADSDKTSFEHSFITENSLKTWKTENMIFKNTHGNDILSNMLKTHRCKVLAAG